MLSFFLFSFRTFYHAKQKNTTPIWLFWVFFLWLRSQHLCFSHSNRLSLCFWYFIFFLFQFLSECLYIWYLVSEVRCIFQFGYLSVFQLLGELLLDRHNFAVMTKYISSVENLKQIMNLLKDNSRSIQLALELCIENSNFAAFWLIEKLTNIIYLTISFLTERGGLLSRSTYWSGFV